jgi:hypothetical protein
MKIFKELINIKLKGNQNSYYLILCSFSPLEGDSSIISEY